MAADAEGGPGEGERDGVREGRTRGHEGGGGEGAGVVELGDGAVDARGEAEVVGVDDEAGHWEWLVLSGWCLVGEQVWIVEEGFWWGGEDDQRASLIDCDLTMRNRLQAAFAAFGIALSAVAASQQPLPAAPRKPALLLGAAWYPEQWPESRWEADLALMQAAHITFVRVGEFAWSTFEPKEGDFELDWMARAVRLAEKHGIAVVMGTPSAAPPAWLTQTYPETLRTREDGRKDEHGNRQQFDWSNPKYRELARLMAEKMAERFGHDPDVIGWQIDNELCELELRAGDAGTVSGVAEGEVRHAGQPEQALDDRVLERDLPGLEPDSDRGAWAAIRGCC